MLSWRLAGATMIVAPLLLLIWLDDQFNGGRPGIWIGPLAVLIGLLAAQEVNQILLRADLKTSALVNLWGVICVMAFSLMPLAWTTYPQDCPVGRLGWTMIGLALAVCCLFAAELYRFRVPGESCERLAGGAFVVVYVGVLLSFLIQLRLMLPGRSGLVAVFATLWIVKLADTGAFFTGKSIGRTRFSVVSPKKTVEGIGGGIVAAILAAWLVRDVVLPYFVPDVSLGHRLAYFAYGATLALVGLLGDLSESILKRDVGQKDSSRWLRGLGGVLDVIDSLLATAPVSFLWWASGWLGGR